MASIFNEEFLIVTSSTFLIPAFLNQLDRVPVRPPQTPKYVLTESEPQNNTDTDGGIVFKSFECYVCKGIETINLSHIISRWPPSFSICQLSSGGRPFTLEACIKPMRRVCVCVCCELRNAVFHGCQQKF